MASPYALLLLPSPPAIVEEEVRDAYEEALASVFSTLSQSLDGTSCTATLDIALAISGLEPASRQPRARVFQPLQHVLTNVYKLIIAVCASRSIELDGPGGIDARVVFVGDVDEGADGDRAQRLGPILSLQTLATSARSWNSIFFVDTASGRKLLNAFTGSLQSPVHTYGVPGGKSDEASSNTLLLASEGPQGVARHYSVAVGGTFDHLHIGHKLLLTATALALDRVVETDTGRDRSITVGVAADELLAKKKYIEFLESWDQRYRRTASFLTSIIDFSPPQDSAPRVQEVLEPGPNGKYVLLRLRTDLVLKLVQFSDIYGPTITDQQISALVVSRETRAGGQAVNTERAKQGWQELEIFEVDVLNSGTAAALAASRPDSFETKISSTEIRRRRMEQAQAPPRST
ncbi:hypothetical protein ASPZODRAFT_144538 [Penicilliopsis zonata CBS 506.65]|uniref:Cytidyltransferase-like domain-containing protein n=1 Tax=Penicilliopsis zonata CBS 506.65 TaxID=1073090 RepID=A0A1L9SBK5_9EURO|nr:hypothetical protein ASPZODRAFT_144538 [Penicilliopsis zonata CBS 506.65]OJJ44572.1 hypothetical protein ASPZODRAFT_144538 [Penicilliopsis zonata CBS 506.65]